MAIKKILTISELKANVVADKQYRSLKEAQRDLKIIENMIDDSADLLNTFQTTLTTAGTTEFTLTNDTTSVQTSPKPKQGKIKSVTTLQKKFRVIHQLYDAKASLESLEAKLRMASRDMGMDSAKAIEDLVRVRKKMYATLDEAFKFIQGEALRTLPPLFGAFIRRLERLVSRAIAYDSAVNYTYVFVADNGDLCYSNYLHLNNAIDDDGDTIPDLIIIASLRIAQKGGATTHFLDVAEQFEPPSDKFFTSVINPDKMQTVAMKMADLLQVTHFANSIKRIPIKLLLSPGNITPDLFSYSDKITKVEVDDSNNQLLFWLKPQVKDKAEVNSIVTQLYLDTKGLVTSTRARARVAMTEKTNSKGNKCWVISFFLIRGDNAPSASVDDLEFLKDRFSLPDNAIREILKTINKGS